MQNDPRPAERLFTVGHSNHEAYHLLELLRRAGVTAVADVRSSPYSQRLSQFNRPQLEELLRGGGMAYVFLGDLLGGRPADRGLYDAAGWVDYERVRQTEPFRRGLDRLVAGLERYVVALLCAEADPLDCHRGLMIAPALAERGLAPLHLRRDGTVETTLELERRLLQETRVGQGLVEGLFAPIVTEAERRALLAEAYRIMNRKKAYRIQEEDGPA